MNRCPTGPGPRHASIEIEFSRSKVKGPVDNFFALTYQY